MLLHGNPGQPTDWLTAARRRSHRAHRGAGGQAGHPRHARGPPERPHGRQPLRRHPVPGQRRDLHHQGRHRGRRHPAAHDHQRQGPRHRRHVDGRVLRASTSASSTPTCSRSSLDFSGETASVAGHRCPAATRRSSAAPTGSRRPTPTARPSTVSTLDGKQGSGDLDGRGHRRRANPRRRCRTFAPQLTGQGLHRRVPHPPRSPRLRTSWYGRRSRTRCPGRRSGSYGPPDLR